MENVLRFDDYSLKIKTSGKWHEILNAINFILVDGECLALVGSSGSGKSMILRSMMNLFEDIQCYETKGSIHYRDKVSVLDLPEVELSNYRSGEISLIMQQSSQVLNPSNKIIQEFELSAKSAAQTFDRDYFVKILKEVGFESPENILTRYPHELSGGQVQRILIASALVRKSRVLLVDEPTSNLDAKLKNEILDLLRKLQGLYGFSMVMVSHDLNLIKNYCDSVIILNKGKIVEQGKSQDVFNNPQNDFTKSLIKQNSFANRQKKTIEKGCVLSAKNISMYYSDSKWSLLKAKKNWVLKNLDLDLYRGEILGVVGESGSGKSSLARIISGLVQASEGKILYNGQDILNMSKKEHRTFRKEVQIIFQDALSSLPPHLSAYRVLKEVSDIHALGYSEEMLKAYIENYGLPSNILNKRVSEMSGGQRQRLLIARALITEPQVLICDEIVSSLDSLIKTQILELILKLKEEKGISIIFISHDLALIDQISDRIVDLGPRF